MTGVAGAGAAAIAGRLLAQANDAAGGRPNILWIVSEDNNPYLGCYGDKLARTPTIDQLAKDGVLYENCFSQAPVCAPSRFTLITGMYATSCQPANQMRASGKGPPELRGFPAYLREAGYHTTNSAKTDYNAAIKMADAWDASGNRAHWRNRPRGKPFFAVFNHEVTHESCLFGGQDPLPGGTDRRDVRIPAYCPDTPETRADRALYYDQHRRLDGQVAKLLDQLKADGLEDDTIVFYYGDNGGVLPRSKRFAYDSGLHVPLIIRFGKKWQHLAPSGPGTRVESPVSFVDFAPTVLSLAGVNSPKYFQGRAFAGAKKAAEAGEYAFCHRDRMDERYDLVRTARDKRYRYIRNYRPDLPWGQHVQYMFQQRGYRAWEKLHKAGKLNEVQERFWGEKPAEELYDLSTDPDEVKNLVDSPEHKEVLGRMRAALRGHILEIRDNGFIPEGSPLEGFVETRDEGAYPLAKIVDFADVVTRRDVENLPRFVTGLGDANEVMRYWAALGCLMLREKAGAGKEALVKALGDASPHVRVVAAEALCRIGEAGRGLAALSDLLTKDTNAKVRLQAANALDHLGIIAKPALGALKAAGKDVDDYVKRAADYTAAVLAGEEPPQGGE
ncbi:MAG: sulfatase [Phycisphaerales bacterium]|nr:sulfatase [Phycisphaerales bacterium]